MVYCPSVDKFFFRSPNGTCFAFAYQLMDIVKWNGQDLGYKSTMYADEGITGWLVEQGCAGITT